MPAAPQYKALFPVAHSGPRQVFVTWVRQMVETVTLGKIAKDDEESMICVVRVTMRQEHSMSVYTSSSVCAWLQSVTFYPEALLTLGSAGEKQLCLWSEPHHESPCYPMCSSVVYSLSGPEPENRKTNRGRALTDECHPRHTSGNRLTFPLKFNVTLLNAWISNL